MTLVEIKDLKKGDVLIVFDYASEIINEKVTIFSKTIDGDIFFKRENGETVCFSGQGDFYEIE